MMVLEERVGATVVLTLNYPERRNALAMQMRAELGDAIDRIEGDYFTILGLPLTGLLDLLRRHGVLEL